MIEDRYDAVIVGSGPGSGTMAWRLAQTGKRILLIERGDYLRRERENWDTREVFAKGRYQADETWTSSSGDTFRPGLHYVVGGNSKFYGAVLLRLRERHHALREMLRQICDKADIYPHLVDRKLYLGKDTPIGGTAHQAGTLRFGEDPTSSVLDLDCRAHGIDNLYVTDASFFPSIGAVNPTLTIIANALRVADHVASRLGARLPAA